MFPGCQDTPKTATAFVVLCLRYRLTGYSDLRDALFKEINAESVVLDGELVVTDHQGRTIFADMMQRRKPARYFAFDLLSFNGEDLRRLRLVDRK